MPNLKIFRTPNSASFFTKRNHKKALVRLQQVDKESKEVKDLGFGFKAKKENKLIVVTSSSTLPEGIQADEIVVDRFRSKSKNWNYKANPQDQVIVESIHVQKQDGITFLIGTGGNEEEFFNMANKDDIGERTLSAFAFEDKKILELQFENKQGPCHFTWKSKEDFDAKKAKGAPIIYKDRTGSVIVIGLLSTDSNGQLYPLLFTKDFNVPRSPSDEPSQASDQHSDQRPSTSGIAGDEPSQTSDQHSDQMSSTSSMAGNEPSQPSDQHSGATNVTYNITIKDNAKVAVGDYAQFTNVENPTDQPAEKDDLSSRAEEYTGKLKSSIKRQTESMPALEGQTAVTIDDVFTNVTIQRGERSFSKDQEKRTYGREQFDVFQASSTTLKNRSEMFIWPENDDPNSKTLPTTNPKCILITGVAGIGKSEYLKKVVWDWADDQLLEKDPKYPDFKFAFKLKFSQLGLLDHEELNLCDILNRSSLLDEQSVIDKGLLQYMIENPEKVLIIFDGYDEYPYRTEITGKLEEKYPNDPHQKMPVPAMIAKIMKGKILNESVVMISSRPEEAQELLPKEAQEVKKFPFDVKCEIKGFSPVQVQEYIQKYFKDNESMKSAVLEHIKMNEILLSFGHIPVMCYLMCYYLKWHMTLSTTENLPITRSELYYEVIKVFITRHSHSSSKDTELTETEVEEMLHKLAELAIYLMREKKVIFTEDMMKSFKFSEQELTNLKKSGLFDCCPGVKKSPFDKPPLEFVFSHLTMQEFLCALGFVEKKQLPERWRMSKVIWTFMAGLLRRKNDENLMDQLLEKIKPKDRNDHLHKVLTLHCLYEYKDDGLSRRVINRLHDKYCNSDGWISFVAVNDLDCLAIRYFLYIVQFLTQNQTTKHLASTQSFIVNTLYISNSSLSPSGVSVLCESLSNLIPDVTGLVLEYCRLDDECVKIIAQTLNKTTINNLSLGGNRNITAKGIRDICAVLSDCSVEELNLSFCELDDECVEIIAQTLNKTTINYLSLRGNRNITTKGIRDICAVLSDCSVETLNMSFCGLDDECAKIIARTLNKIRITDLRLAGNNITDEGVMCVCDVVSKRDCPVEVLDLRDNDKIADECKKSVRKLLQLNKPDVLLKI